MTKVFPGGVEAVRDLNLAVKRGEQVAIIGPSGAGKTTLLRLLNLTLPPSAGRLWVDGLDSGRLKGRGLRHMRSRIGTVYQQHNLVARLTVVHNVLAGRLGAWSVPRALWSLAFPQELERAVQALEAVAIPEKLAARTDELSGGQQQRVAIARVLVQDPEVILADEPIASVDPAVADDLIRLFVELAHTHNKTLIVNLHAIEFALKYFPRVVGLREGRIVFDTTPARLSPRVLEELYRGEPAPEGSEPTDDPSHLTPCGPLD